VPQDAAVAAMGDAGTALPFTPAAVFWNPSTPAFLPSFQASAEYGQLYSGLSQTGCFALKAPLQNQIAISALYIPFLSGDMERHSALEQSVIEMEETGNWPSGEPDGIFHNDQHLFGLSIAKLFPLPVPRPGGFSTPFPVDFGVGCSFKWFWQYMNPDGITRMGMNVNLDLGMILRIGAEYDLARKRVNREIYLGVALKDVLPSRVIWMYTTEPYQEVVDMASYFGMAYVDKTGLLWADWTISAGIKKSYDVTYHWGIEATLFEIASIRAGLSNRIPTIGAGVAYKRYTIDYAFRFDEIAYSPLRLSLGFSF
jgi:hypothetical protein